jgi:peptidoglycan lytic transglycosylase
MTRLHRSLTTTLIALIAGWCWLGVADAATALASSGGASAPVGSSPSARGKANAHGKRKRHSAKGIATWFGPGFYGQKTACGQTLTPAMLGIASRTLPCGTLVRVSFRGRVVVVPVLDRGPYGGVGAEWDLTAGAASALGALDTIRVRTKIVGRVANTPALGAPAVSPQVSAAGGAQAG